MSNRVAMAGCTFTDVDGAVSYGFRIWDDHAQTYGNMCESRIADDLDLLRYLVANYSCEVTWGLLDESLQKGMCINGTWYESEVLHPIIMQDEDGADE
jgi:hypothetical protein